MLLAVDIGNTNLVLGLFEKEALRHSWRVVTRPNGTHDEHAVLFRNLFALEGLTFDVVRGMVVCSVVPSLNEVFQSLGTRYFKMDPIFVEPTEQDLMPVRYNPPGDVGADRIMAAVAAHDLVPGPVIVVDFGTATTFDAVSGAGDYLGGVIAPGMGISADALVSRTSKLPRMEIRKPSQVIGDSTVSSMQSGLYFGYVGLVEGILSRMKQELPGAKVVATGGLAHLVAEDSGQIDRVESDLILNGLFIYFNYLNDKT